MNELPRPGTPEFLSAIDGAQNIEEIDALRAALDYTAAEFCRRADLNESAYSRRRRGATKAMRPKTARALKDTLRRLSNERAGSATVVALRPAP